MPRLNLRWSFFTRPILHTHIKFNPHTFTVKIHLYMYKFTWFLGSISRIVESSINQMVNFDWLIEIILLKRATILNTSQWGIMRGYEYYSHIFHRCSCFSCWPSCINQLILISLHLPMLVLRYATVNSTKNLKFNCFFKKINL